MKRQAINITNEAHQKLCDFSLKTGMKKTVIAERAVLQFIGSFGAGEFACAQKQRAARRVVKKS